MYTNNTQHTILPSYKEGLHSIFEFQAKKIPDAVAVIYEENELTYEELNQRANQIAYQLQALGVGPDTLVGIYMERSLELIIGLLGILKAGGAYVPLDPMYPKERLTFMIEDANPLALLTQTRFFTGLTEYRREIICLDRSTLYSTSPKVENPKSTTTVQSLAYVIYTSGSTDKPKGVCCKHKGVANLLADFQNRQPLLSGDHCSFWASFCFDVSVYEIFSSLLSGGTLHIIPESLRSDGTKVIDWLCTQRIQSAFLPPFMLSDLRAYLQKGKHPPLRRLLVGVEPISEQMLTEIYARIPGLHIINGYGPTEACICATLYSVLAQDAIRQNAPIGIPVHNTQAYLLDAHLQPVPTGEPGELYIGGVGLARGYLRRAGLTAESFIPNPFGFEAGSQLYKTGDLARLLPDGNIEFIGRADHQVKIRGFRIELGEIEATLVNHPCIREVVVDARETTSQEKQLVAYIVAQQGSTAAAGDLRMFLQNHLPEYMIPSVFVFLNELPLTPSGKFDRRALPAPGRATPPVAPRNEVEEKLVDAWKEVLSLEIVSIFDNFFEIGGHSLTATRVLSRLRETFQEELPLYSLFENPTIAELAHFIKNNGVKEQPQFPPILPTSRDGEIPLSFSQENLWFLLQLQPSNLAYHFQAMLRLTGQLNVRDLERSLREIVRRHEIFRTTFPSVDTHPIQCIHSDWTGNLPVTDLRWLPDHARETEALRLIYQESRKPFDIMKLPLVRWILLQLSEHEYILVHTEHHLIHDGWSFNVLLQELREIYQAISTGNSPSLPNLPIQFADFAVWQRGWLQGEVLAAQLAYWKEKLAGLPPLLELPMDRPRPAEQSFTGASFRVDFPLPLCNALREVSRHENTTLFMTLLAAFFVLLHRYTDQVDLCIGTGVANRRWQETERLIGMVVNTLAIRVDISGNSTFQEFLKHVRKVTIDAYAHQDLPFGKVVEALQPNRSLSYSPLYQIMFSFHDSPLVNLDLPGLHIDLTEGLSNGSAKFDLNVIALPGERRNRNSLEGDAGEITFVWEYNTDLFHADTIHRMMEHFRILLENIILDPNQRIAEIVLLPAYEQEKLLIEWTNTQKTFSSKHCAHVLFEQCVQQTPDAVAVESAAGSLTYYELNKRANQLAYYLRERGVKAEIPVGICIERSMELLVGILGIMKAGGAYVPVDPSTPKERSMFIYKDVHVSIILTQEKFRIEQIKDSFRAIYIDTEWQNINRYPSENMVQYDIIGENLAYIIYTSGSTGTPKGVQIQHNGLLNLIFWHQQAFGVSLNDRASLIAGPAFDASVWEIWPYLTTGASLAIPDEETRISPVQLRDWLIAKKITLSFLPTPLAESMLLIKWPDDVALHTLLTGGDMLRRCPPSPLPFRFVNNYGPTESTVVTTSGLVSPEEQTLTAPSIGYSINNIQTYILDSSLHPVPIGIPGELYISGEGLARGYVEQPELTAKRFIPNPFSQLPGDRIYRTGDIARYLPEGKLEFIGRRDYQVKIRGYRIELEEIEAVLARHPQVLQCAVIVHTDATENKSLAAYIVCTSESLTENTIDSLRAYLKLHLPDYMLPSTFVILDTLPVTPNGKIDRQTLQIIPGTFRETQAVTVAPRDPVELQLVQIFEAVLGVYPVGVTQGFFDLGGYSLAAVRLMAHIRHIFGQDLPLSVLFQAQTAEKLAIHLRTRSGVSAAPLVALQPQGIKLPFYCIHTAGGEVLRYVRLAHHLGLDQPLYGIQSPYRYAQNHNEEAALPPTTVEATAESYIRHLYTQQPQGPYYLGGLSFGGLVAFEMALQLQKQGQEVGVLALLDTRLSKPGLTTQVVDETTLMAGSLWEWVQELAEWATLTRPQDSSFSIISRETLQKMSLEDQINYYLGLAKDLQALPPDTEFQHILRFLQIRVASMRAIQRYWPQAIFQGSICLFRTTESDSHEETTDVTRGWQQFSSEPIRIYYVPGTHDTLTDEPHVQVLAKQLKTVL